MTNKTKSQLSPPPSSPRQTQPGVRTAIRSMQGYAPGEQPPPGTMIKLNTNENPYPPSPRVKKAWQELDISQLRTYPDPVAQSLRETAAAQFGLQPEQVIAGNGSDDLLTIGVRTFIDQNSPLLHTQPSYSLYPVLGQIQGAQVIALPLDENFQLPSVLPANLNEIPLLLLARPNAPTATVFPQERMEQLCREFKGVIWIDEAYADFAEDHCLELIKKFSNVVVSRSLSKSYSLAGLRVGLAFASSFLIEQMMKVKDSYNLSLPAQVLAKAALEDGEYMEENKGRIKTEREKLMKNLTELGFSTLPSQANFIFTRPPLPAPEFVEALRQRSILIRYFPGPRTEDFVRITIGQEKDMNRLLEASKEIVDTRT